MIVQSNDALEKTNKVILVIKDVKQSKQIANKTVPNLFLSIGWLEILERINVWLDNKGSFKM